MRRFGPAGIALGSSLGATVNVVFHLRDLDARVGAILGGTEWRAFAVRLLVSGAGAPAGLAAPPAAAGWGAFAAALSAPVFFCAVVFRGVLAPRPPHGPRLLPVPLAVTVTDPFPRVLVVRRGNIPGARYFGPYTGVAAWRQTLKIIRRIFTVRSCHWDLPHDAPNRPCLDYHIERCRAPCVGYQSEADYRRMIDDVLLFLEGKTVDVRTRLRERMHEASQRLDFERAAQLRDALKWLDQLEQPQAVELIGGGDADAVGLARDGDDVCGVVLRVRDGKLIARDHWFLENAEHETEGAILAAFLVRCYLPLEPRARHALLPFAPDDLDALQQVAPDSDWHVPQRGTFAKLAQLADQNARHLLDSLKIESFDIDERSADPVFALGRDLGLAAVPRSFVCIDISTNQGRDTVGSLVWFG